MKKDLHRTKQDIIMYVFQKIGEAFQKDCSVEHVEMTAEGVSRRCSGKKMFLNSSQNWQENTCVGNSS